MFFRHLNRLESRLTGDISQILRLLQQQNGTQAVSPKRRVIPHVQISIDDDETPSAFK